MFLVNVHDGQGRLIMQSYVPQFPGRCKVAIIAIPPTAPTPAQQARQKKRKGKHRG